MKIVLRAFGNKLSGVMEVPEETGHRFKLAMVQSVHYKKVDDKDYPLMDSPIDTICEFEWSGGTFHQEGHDWDNAREYQLISITKR